MRLEKDFYKNHAFIVGPMLIGKLLVRKLENGEIMKHRITETEVYFGEEDAACHARFGRTDRSEILYNEGGYAYIYLCYGIHNLLNVVTGEKNHPEAVLIRAVEGYVGPGKLTKIMNITRELNKIDLNNSDELWIEDDGYIADYYTAPRVGIDYAAEPFKSIQWRYIMKEITEKDSKGLQ